MAAALAEQIAFLNAKGFGGVEHDSHVPFLAHLGAVRGLLVQWGARPALRDAGLFHSIYGTEYFDAGLGEVGRDEVRAIIGAAAERIAWLWCWLRRDTIAADTASAVHRATGRLVELERQEIVDLTELWVADFVEQRDRLGKDERNPWARLVELSPLASAPAQAAFARSRRA